MSYELYLGTSQNLLLCSQNFWNLLDEVQQRPGRGQAEPPGTANLREHGAHQCLQCL